MQNKMILLAGALGLGLVLTVGILATIYSQHVFAQRGGGTATGIGAGRTANGIGVGGAATGPGVSAGDVTKANANNTNATNGKGGVAMLNTTSGTAKRP